MSYGRDDDNYTSGGGYSRNNDGLDPSSTSDTYGGSRTGGGNTGGGYTRGNDGLDPSGTSDTYGDSGRGGGDQYRRNDGLDSTGTSDAYGGGSYGGTTRGGNDAYNGRSW